MKSVIVLVMNSHEFELFGVVWVMFGQFELVSDGLWWFSNRNGVMLLFRNESGNFDIHECSSLFCEFCVFDLVILERAVFLGFVILWLRLSEISGEQWFLPPLSPMIDGLYGDQLGLNEILVDQSAPDLGSKNLEDKRTKKTN